MTQPPDWWSQLSPGIHNAPPRVPGPDIIAFTWQQLQQIVAGFVNEFLRQVAVALGAVEIFGFKPYEALVEIGENIASAKANFDALLAGFGLPTMDDVAELLANQASDFATFLAATGQATFAALGAALQALIDFLTAIPANLLSGALPTTVTLSGTQLGTLLQYLNSSGQYAAAQLTGALNTGLTFSGTALSVLLQYLNGSGQFSAAQLTGGINTAVTFGGTQLGTLLQYLNSSGQFAAGQLTGAINGSLTLGGVTLSTLVTNINSSGQILAAGITGALGTGLTVGGVTLSTLFTNINSSGQILGAGITGAINTAATIGGTALSTLSTNWNAAVTNVNNLIGGVTGASTAADVATNINLAATNITQIGAAAQNAANGVVGSLNSAATQVQTAFSGIINSLFGGFTGTPAPANQTQAQVTAAAQNVATNFVGNAATFVGIQNAEAAAANLMSVKFNFADYGTGTVALPSSFTVSNDPTYTNNGGGMQIVDGRATYQATGVGSAHKLARYNVAPTTTDYMEVSWVHTGDQDGAGGSGHSIVYARMNSAATSFLQFITLNGNTLAVNAVVAGSGTAVTSYTNMKPGARYVIKCGDLSNNRKIYLYENDALVLSFTDAVHQVGASYRYAAFGVSGNNTGTQLRNFAFNVFGVADQVFKPGPAAAAYVSTSETTTSTSYTDLTTTSDTVTATIGSSGMALVLVSANLQNNTQASRSYMGFAVSGATTQAAADSYSISIGIPASVANMGNHSGSFLVTGLNAGSNTFKAKYRVSATTGTFADRRIAVIPL